MVIVSFAGWLAWLSPGEGVSLVSGYVKDSPPGVSRTSTGQARLAAASGHGRIHRSEDARHGGSDRCPPPGLPGARVTSPKRSST
jgi:hypothetical protein